MIIFICSIIFSLFIFLIEQILGIDSEFHPDSLTYLNFSDEGTLVNFIEDPLNYIGSLYYVLVALFNNNVNFLIIFNIIIFSLTNLFIYLKVKSSLYKKNYFYFILSLLLIFDPYRAHLSVHVLKDTLIIFSLISIIYLLNSYVSVFFFILGIFLRFNFYGYLPILFPFLKLKKNFFLILFFFIICLPLITFSELGDDKISLSFREFDKIPNFFSLGYPYAEIMRALTWPFIRIFNFAIFFHPIYFLFMLQAIVSLYLLYLKKIFFNYNFLFFYFVLALIAIAAPGYNTYLRYTQPVITTLYIWIILMPYKSKIKKINVNE
jgi:hypothetical protein